MGTLTIQPGQPGEGMTYNVHKPLLYPFHVDVNTGDCVRGRGTSELGDVPKGRLPWRLLGFQGGGVQKLVLTFEEFVAEPQSAVGLVPVFTDDTGIFAITTPITDVTAAA